MTDFDAGPLAAKAVGELADGQLGGDDSTAPSPDSSGGTESTSSDGSSGSEDVIDITDVLLHSEPDLSVDDVQERIGLGPAGANALIGTRKCIHAVTGSGGGSGTPAIVNFATAGYHFVVAPSSSSEDDSGDDDVPDEAPTVSGVPGA